MAIRKIKKEALVEKRNILNEVRENNMTLQELRFFSIYLSRINARDLSTRLVRFALSDFQKIMGLSRVQAKDIDSTVDGLLRKIVHVPTETGGFMAFQLFKRCRVDQDSEGNWYVEIDAHDDALPLMFDFKTHYFTYQLWNALRLRSVNQLRMYELLKQYEHVGERVIDLAQLRKWLGVELDEYPRWDNFKVRVLDSCQRGLAENTDIKFTYEPIRKGRKGFSEIRFIIERNASYIDRLTLDQFIDLQPEPLDVADDEREAMFDDHLKFLAGACDYEFTNAQMQVVFDILRPVREDLKRYDVLKAQYDKMKLYAEQGTIRSRFGYLKKLLTGAL